MQRFVDDVLAWEEHGPADAPLALCLHGFPDHPPSFRPLAERLVAAGHRVAAPYLPGYAPSPTGGPYDPASLGAWTVRAADHLAPGAQVSLIGHDWGAVATYAAIARAPERFACAVAMAVPHPRAFVRGLARFPAQLARSAYMLFFQLPAIPERVVSAGDFALVDWLWRRWSPGIALDDRQRAELHRCLADSMPAPLDYYRALRSGATSSWEAVGDSDVPTAILHGDRDRCIGPALFRDQQRHLRGPLEVQRLAGLGHFLHIEDPDAVAAPIVAWLERHHAGRA